MKKKKRPRFEDLHAIRFRKLDGASVLLDAFVNPILWPNGDDKCITGLQGLTAIWDFLNTFGYRFQALWDIDEDPDHWVIARIYEDGREKEINKRFWQPSMQRS